MQISPDLTRRPRTRRVFSDADMIRLRDLYYDPSVPLVWVGEAFGVPVSTLLRWVAEMGWPRRSDEAARIGPRCEAATQAVAGARATEAAAPAPRRRSRRRRKPASPVDLFDLASDVAAAAKAEIDALREEAPPRDWAGRRQRAAVIEQLSRAVTRLERMERSRPNGFEALSEALRYYADIVEREREAESARAPAPASSPAPQRKRREAPVVRYGVGGMPEW